MDELPATISIAEAGELLGVSRRTAYRAAARGQIPTVRIGRRLFVPTLQLLRLLGHEPDEDVLVNQVARKGSEKDTAPS